MVRTTTWFCALCVLLMTASARAAIIYDSPNGRLGTTIISSSETAPQIENEVDSDFDADLSLSVLGSPGVTMHGTNDFTFLSTGFSGNASAYASLVSTLPPGDFASAQVNGVIKWSVDSPQTLYLWGNLDYREATSTLTLKDGASTIFSESHTSAENDQNDFLFSWLALPGHTYHLTYGLLAMDQDGGQDFIFAQSEINLGPVVPEPSTYALGMSAMLGLALHRMRCRRRK